MLECHCAECQGTLVSRGWWIRHQQSLRTREQLQAILQQRTDESGTGHTQDQGHDSTMSRNDPPSPEVPFAELPRIEEELRSLEAIFASSLTELTFIHPPTLTSQLGSAPDQNDLAVDEQESSNRSFVYATSTLAHLRARLAQVQPTSDTQISARRGVLDKSMDQLQAQAAEHQVTQWFLQGQRQANTSAFISSGIPVVLTGLYNVSFYFDSEAD